jgi:hypothetical protein
VWGASQPYDMVGNTVTRIGRTSRGREAETAARGDGGKSWVKVTGGFPAGELGRIGLNYAPSNPRLIWSFKSLLFV